jgi:hypothetical protein
VSTATLQTTSESCGRVWKIPGMPHKGWECTDVVDLNPDDLPSDEVEYGTCEVCGNHPIRFVHTIEHVCWPYDYRVGCICAGHLTADVDGARKREGELKRASARRARHVKRIATARAKWPDLGWRLSAKGNLWLKHRGVLIVVDESWRDKRFVFSVDGEWDRREFASPREAVLASFDVVHARDGGAA